MKIAEVPGIKLLPNGDWELAPGRTVVHETIDIPEGVTIFGASGPDKSVLVWERKP